MEKQNYYIKWAALLAAIAVCFGALGAHTLEKLLSTKSLTAWETAVRYQLIHSVAILILALNDKMISDKKSHRILNLFILGIVFLVAVFIYYPHNPSPVCTFRFWAQ